MAAISVTQHRLRIAEEREAQAWVHPGGSLKHIPQNAALLDVTASIMLDGARMMTLIQALLPSLDRAALVAVRNAADARVDAMDECEEPGCECHLKPRLAERANIAGMGATA